MTTPESKFVISAENRASGVIQRVQSDMAGLGSSAMSVASRFASFGASVPLALAAMGAAFVASVKDVADLQDSMGKLAQRTGIGVSALSELNYAAKLSDVSTDELANGVSRLTAKMADVAQGSKAAAGIFESLGVKVKNSDGSLRSADEVLKDIAQRFSEFPDGPEKSAFAIEIFGRAGAKLIPLLNQGRAGLADAADEARRFGIVVDEKAAKAAELFNDNLTRLSASAEGLKISLLQDAVPALAAVTQRFLDARAAGVSFLESFGIATAIPALGGKTLDDRIADLQKTLAGAKTGQTTGWFSNDVRQAEEDLKHLLSLRRVFQTRETREFAGSFNGALLAGGGSHGGTPPRLPSSPGSASAKLGQADLTDEQKLIIDSHKLYADAIDKTVGASKRYALALQMLDTAYFDGEMSAGDYDDAMKRLTKTTATFGKDGEKALRDFADAWLDQIDPMRKFTRELERVDTAVQDGFLSEGAAEEIRARLVKALEPLSEADDWTKRLGKNIQSTLGDHLFDVLDGKVTNLGKSFSTMLKRIAADVMAANLARDLLGDMSKTGVPGGWVGGALGWLGEQFKSNQHADGLDYVPYDGYPAILHRGERVLTAAEAKSGTSSITVAPNITVNGEMSRSQEARLAVMMRNVAEATIANRQRRMLA